jgi:uncharacterized protein YbcC (UPF0753/DUF2309 family)
VARAAELLPNQAIIENFVHNNPLKLFERMNFSAAVEYAHKLESYMSPGARVFAKERVDPRKRANDALAELSSVFLDRGAAKWAPPFRDQGFLYFFAVLERLGFAPWRKEARRSARRIVSLWRNPKPNAQADLAEEVLRENLEYFGVPEEEWTDVIRSMLLELRGWAGMFNRIETHPTEAPHNAKVRLIDFCAVQSILIRSSIESLGQQLAWPAEPLSSILAAVPKFHSDHEDSSHTSAIAFVDQHSKRREHLEKEFQNTLLHAIGTSPVFRSDTHRPALQLYTCIDDRSCSLRRHVEEINPKEIETFGVAGFFGIPIRYKPIDGADQMILAPEGNNPHVVLEEAEYVPDHDKAVLFQRRRHFLAQLSCLWEAASFSPLGSLALALVSPLLIARLLLMAFSPNTKRRMKEYFSRAVMPKPRTAVGLPFSPEEGARLLAQTFRDIGTRNRFAPIVIVLGHGSVSVNNPFAAAYNCGACGGREGGPNARLLARLGNDAQVRQQLLKEHRINIPIDTVFVGGMHNTTTDAVDFYDVDALPESHHAQFAQAARVIRVACGKNALERCHRFLLAARVRTPEEALQHVQMRSADAAEVRPELNHATNGAAVIGRRELTKGCFLDRRVFLPSYDPFSDDADGTNLEHVLAPALLVCSGINLEYLFSTIQADHHGAGTKAPLNIVANVGLQQGTVGDLRPGLPSQMTEMHSPIRAAFVVDAPIETVEAVLARRVDLRQLVRNQWVLFFVRDPSSNQFFQEVQGQYRPVAINECEATKTYIPFTVHLDHGLRVAHREDLVYMASFAAMVLSCVVPIYLFGADSMLFLGPAIAVCGTTLSLPVLSFARRYLHGEFMFGRFALLCNGLLLGFNLVATAPSLEHVMAGWSLFGFSSTFLIGAYNDRASVRNNATFAFAAYRFSDFALLVAATFHGLDVSILGLPSGELVAGCLLLAALFKSSQFPLIGLFARSMEGPTPASALGYAGLSAHVGIILLCSTMPLWHVYHGANVVLGSVGLFTAAYSSLLSKIRSDRKGAIANATSATIGLIFVVLALGYRDLALLLSLGHATFRIIQVLRSPNAITDANRMKDALGYAPWPRIVPPWLYKFTWTLHQFVSDFQLVHVLQMLTRRVPMERSLHLSKVQQWALTGLMVALAGAPFTPVSHFLEEFLMEVLPHHPMLAGGLMLAHLGFSVVLIRFLLLNVLDKNRFLRASGKIENQKKL